MSNNSTPKLYVLVGVPGSGKSTWAELQDWKDSCAYVSTDKHVETWAKGMGKTYNEVFYEVMPRCVSLMTHDVKVAREKNKDIIWDQTSTTVNSRKKKFNMLPNYYKIAVVFKTPEQEELNKRLNSRPGKNIPEDVMKSMIDGFELPTVEEGFDEVWFAT